jgi:hypothetical protein
MSETVINHSEQERSRNALPQGDELREIYALEFSALDLPDTFRMTNDHFESNVELFTADTSAPHYGIEEVQEAFVKQAAERAYRDSWWVNVGDRLRERAIDPAAVDRLSLAAQHTLDIMVDDQPTGQNFEVFELGEPEEDRQAVETVFNTLTALDQFSGGLMAADPDRPKIILSNGVRLEQNLKGGEIGGFAIPGAVLINMPALKEQAREADADFHALLAIVVSHEALGHGLERLVKGDTGRYFGEHFDYSRQKVPGEIFHEVHESVKPVEETAAGSQPVREYGKVNSSEDFATSVDAIIAEAMGWAAGVETMPRFKSSPDEHRSELAKQLMQEAAEKALAYDHTPGFVGSKVRYITDADGNVSVRPERMVEVTTLSGREAIEDQVTKQVIKFAPGDQFVVSIGDYI